MLRRPALLPLIALLLLMQAVVAPALCLAHAAARAGGGHSVEICGPEGLQTIRLNENGDPVQDAAPMPGGFCFACHAIPDASFAVGPEPVTPHWVRVALAIPARIAAHPAPAIRGPPLGAQAPPFLA
ncbi:hypothetical protein [Plastoroseomonas arctica]|uniref:DUF2946 domain-containing protein n=1 Tax=Plastoroseomonas arctica TaxID=1509237 RepID=A0AAF1KNU3_9PROT|nr:hypothetical protein [Plastoroseomonas arctica]MBR0655033.1 hypothetical protein [Plastoroseomonas arctica]